MSLIYTLSTICKQHPDREFRKELSALIITLNRSESRVIERLLNDIISGRLPLQQTERRIDTDTRLIVSQIQRALSKRDTGLLIVPSSSQKILTMFEQPSVTINDLQQVIQHDPTLVAKIMSAAASTSFYGSQAPNLKAAIIRLGNLETRRIIEVIATDNIYKSNFNSLNLILDRLYIHSATVANLAYLIAKHKALSDPYQYNLSALFHDVGKLYILKIVNEMIAKKELKEDILDTLILKVFKVLHGKLGSIILKLWGFDSFSIRVALEHEAYNESVDMKMLVIQSANEAAKLLGYSEFISPEINGKILKLIGLSTLEIEGFRPELEKFVSLLK